MKRLLLSLLAALAISLPLFSQEYVGDSGFLVSGKTRAGRRLAKGG